MESTLFVLWTFPNLKLSAVDLSLGGKIKKSHSSKTYKNKKEREREKEREKKTFIIGIVARHRPHNYKRILSTGKSQNLVSPRQIWLIRKDVSHHHSHLSNSWRVIGERKTNIGAGNCIGY